MRVKKQMNHGGGDEPRRYALEVTMENREKTLSNTSEMVIGRNRYIVTTHFKENGRETAEDKLLHFVTERISAKFAKDGLCA